MDENRVLEAILKLESTMNQKFSELKTEMQETRADVKELKTGLKETQAAVVEAVDVVGDKVEQLENSLKDMEVVTARNAYDLQLIKGKKA